MKEKAKITGLKVSNFKRVNVVEIQPEKNGLTIIGGNNQQGKTSILNAIAYGLGGEAFRPSAVNNTSSEESANIRVEIDGLIVERSGKNASLKVTDPRGMKGGQSLLNEIVSKFALDLGSFLNAPDKAKILLTMFPELEGSLDKLKEESDNIRTQRTDINRDMKRLQVQVEGTAIIENIPEEEIIIEELSSKLESISAMTDKLNDKKHTLQKYREELSNLEYKITTLSSREPEMVIDAENIALQEQAEIKSLEEEFSRRKEEIKIRFQRKKDDASSAMAKMKDDICEANSRVKQTSINIGNLTKEIGSTENYDEQKAEILNKIKTAGDTNEKIRRNIECKRVYKEWEEMRAESEKLTTKLHEVDKARIEMLQNANLPLADLSINDEGKLLYNGQEWDCMAGAERLKVATAICMGEKPECGFVLIDGLETMDAPTLEEFSKFLAEKGMQGIGTIVGDQQATLIIEDGIVKENK